MSDDTNKRDFLILYNKMSQHLEDLHNWLNQYLQMMEAWGYKFRHGFKTLNIQVD